jgi:RNA polymerase sigma-70 factor, ECF subfamily
MGSLAAVLPTPEPEPPKVVMQAEAQRALLDLISALPPEVRSVFILRDVEGLSTSKTAATMGISEGLVKWRLHHARKRLREQLIEPPLAGPVSG